MKTKNHKQLFRISSEVWNSVALDDVVKTFDDMRAMNLHIPPFQSFAIEVDKKFSHRFHHLFFKSDKTIIDYGLYIEYFFNAYPNVDTGVILVYRTMPDGIYLWDDDVNEMILQKVISKDESLDINKAIGGIGTIICALLQVLLATKNSVREQKLDKQLANGKFNKANKHRKDYPLTTTIRIGKITDTMRSSDGQTYTVRPHLRRGHIRNQHYGPKNEMVKSVFIQPVFVNADEGWIAERRAYNVG